LAISIYCKSSDVRNKSFEKRAQVYPSKALLQKILQAEFIGEHIEKKPIDYINWDTKLRVEGELESGGKTRGDGKLLVTSKLPDRLV